MALGLRQFQRNMPPPPARPIFPPEYPVFNRVHVRSRPGSARPFTRSGPSPLPETQHMRVPSVLSSNPSRPSTRSDAVSDVLGPNSMYLEVRRASPMRPRAENGRPTTMESTVPRLRSRRPTVEVVSCGTQTTPPPTTTTFGREAKLAASVERVPSIDTEASEAVASRSRRRRKRSRGGNRSGNRLTPASVKTEIIVEDDISNRRQRSHRDQGTQSIDVQANPPMAGRRAISTSASTYNNPLSRGSISSEGQPTKSSHNNEQYYYAQPQVSSNSHAIITKSPTSPLSSTLGSPQIRTTSRSVKDSSRTAARASSKRSPPVVRVEPPTPVYQIPVVDELFDKYPSELNPPEARPSHQSVPSHQNFEAAAGLPEVYHRRFSEQINQMYHHYLLN